MIELKNPHSILEVFRKRPGAVKKLSPPTQAHQADWKEVLRLAEQHRVPMTLETLGDRGRSKQQRGKKVETVRRSGAGSAWIEPPPSLPIEELIPKGVQKGFWIALDSVQDPHNVGAIFRSASFFGANGIILLEDRAAKLTGVACDVASGGAEHVPYTTVVNLRSALKWAKDQGIWVLGTSEHAESPMREVLDERPWLVILGNEEKGVRRLVQEECDLLCSIAQHGAVGSLNVSVAAGILMEHLANLR